jgi:hypothetical protein
MVWIKAKRRTTIVKQYVCEVCQEASFPTEEEAFQHEEFCGRENKDSVGNEYALYPVVNFGALWQCGGCKDSSSFSSSEDDTPSVIEFPNQTIRPRKHRDQPTSKKMMKTASLRMVDIRKRDKDVFKEQTGQGRAKVAF